jgi:hypothetical protein
VGDRDHVAVKLRVEDADRREAVCDRVSDGTRDRQRGRAVQQDDPAARKFILGVHFGQPRDSVLDDLVIRRRGAEADPEDVVGTDDVECAHGCSPLEIAAHDGRGNCPRFSFPNDFGNKYSMFKHLFPKSFTQSNIVLIKEQYIYRTIRFHICQAPLQGYKSTHFDLLP